MSLLQKASQFLTGPKRVLPVSALAPMQASNIRDLSSSYWLGPLQPVSPVAPGSYRPRQYGYQPGANIVWTPKSEQDSVAVDYSVLRTLADSWDLLRIALERKKRQIASVEFEVRPRQNPDESSADFKKRSRSDKQLMDLKKFFRKPDGQHRWKQWLKMWLEDMLVLDAVALYLERDKEERIASIVPIAGDTINRMLTDQGITPPPPSVAYQQVIYGMPVWNFTSDDLIYGMANERTHRRYGFSPVEQILLTITFGLRRQEWQISEYTSGSVPEALVFLPSDLTIDRVKEVQDWFDSIMSGDMAERRKVRFLPGYGTGDSAKPNVVFPKEPLLKDELDVWLAQVVCACLGISAQPFLKMMNRASAEESNDAAEAEGLKPDVDFVCDMLNSCLDKMGVGEEYEVSPQQRRDPDVLKQAQAEKAVVGMVVKVNEFREQRGLDPDPSPEADMLGTYTANGFIPLAGSVDRLQQTLQQQQTAKTGNKESEPPTPTPTQPKGSGKENNHPGSSNSGRSKATDEGVADAESKPTQSTVSKLEKYSDDEPRDDDGKWTSGGGSSRSGGKEQSGSGKGNNSKELTDKQKKALAAYKPCKKDKQDIADRSEAKLSRALGVPRTKNNSAFDLRNDDVGIEIKTMVDGKNDKVTMSSAALGRKLAEAQAEGLKTFTVVADMRRGGGKAIYYVSPKLGSIRLGSMIPVTLSQLKEMVHR